MGEVDLRLIGSAEILERSGRDRPSKIGEVYFLHQRARISRR